MALRYAQELDSRGYTGKFYQCPQRAFSVPAARHMELQTEVLPRAATFYKGRGSCDRAHVALSLPLDGGDHILPDDLKSAVALAATYLRREIRAFWRAQLSFLRSRSAEELRTVSDAPKTRFPKDSSCGLKTRYTLHC